MFATSSVRAAWLVSWLLIDSLRILSAITLDQNIALRLRSDCRIVAAFDGPRCHPLDCKLVKLRWVDDSSPI
jgi:hypothetical protein